MIESGIATLVRLAAAVVLLLPASPVLAQPAPAETVERLHQAIAEGDRAAASAILAANVLIYEAGYAERSRDEYLSHHFDADAKFAKTVKRSVVRKSEQAAGEMALVVAETESVGTYDGRPIRQVGLETAVLRLIEGRWQIVHLHWSSRKP